MSDNNNNSKEQSSLDKTTVTAPEINADHKKATAKQAPHKKHSKKSPKLPGTLQLTGWFFTALVFISAGAGYYFWGYINNTKENIEQTLSETKIDVSLLSNSLTKSESGLNDKIKTLTTLHAELSHSVQALLSKSSHMRKDWLVSEAEYLVKLAMHRLTLEGDTMTAVTALRSADTRLREAGDPGLLLLRQEISDKITALKSLPIIDISGMSMKISSVIQLVSILPLVTPDPDSIKQSQLNAKTNNNEKKPTNWTEVTSKVISDLSSLIRIRKHDKLVQPLLAPEQRFYLTQNLKLQLEQARTALLHQQENTFRQRLSESIVWIQEYFDQSKTITQSAITSLSSLNKIKLTQQIPDLSYALKMFTDFQAGIRLMKKPELTETKKPLKKSPAKKSPEAKIKPVEVIKKPTKITEPDNKAKEKQKENSKRKLLEKSSDQNAKKIKPPIIPANPGIAL